MALLIHWEFKILTILTACKDKLFLDGTFTNFLFSIFPAVRIVRKLVASHVVSGGLDGGSNSHSFRT